jgi:hypothetical protein
MLVSRKTHTQLTAVGKGTVHNIGQIQPVSGEMEIAVSTIDTNVVHQVEYSDDNFSTIAAYSVPITETANISKRIVPLAVGYRAVRPVMVSESGGTGVKLDCVTKFYTN